LALSIVIGGIGLALLLGRPSTNGDIDAPDASDRVVLRRRLGTETLQTAVTARAAPKSGPATLSVASFPVSLEPTAAVQGRSSDSLPPTLAKAFPSVDSPASARWGVSMGIGMPGARVADQARRTHKIVNGDSLPALAKRYLGSEARADAIYEANRDLLSSPDALPIGIELRIPPQEALKAAAKPTTEPPALVPIAPRGGAAKRE
jgi:nucleoid-associated protein YgaU